MYQESVRTQYVIEIICSLSSRCPLDAMIDSQFDQSLAAHSFAAHLRQPL